MKNINENTKVTLTLGQLKRLVKESELPARVDEFDVVDPDDTTKWQRWEQRIIKKIANSSSSPDCDFLGRPVAPGDWVVFVTGGSRFGAGRDLGIGKVASIKKNITIQRVFGDGSTERIVRPSQYVFRIDDPQGL